MRYFRWISIAALLLASFAVHRAHYWTATVHAGMSYPAVSGAKLPTDGGPSAPLAAEDNFAWEEFATLVHPQAPPGAATPEWLAWTNKCDAGLTAACKPPAPKQPGPKPPDQGAIEFPRQLPEGFHLPVFDSVLFNPIAADSILRGNLGRASSLDLAIQTLDLQNLSGSDRRLPLGSFAFGSEIVKLIWEVLPDDKEEALRLYDPAKPPVAENGTQLLGISGWQARYRIERNVSGEIDQTKECSAPLQPYGTEDNPRSVPVKCFYSFSVQKNSCPFFNQDPQHPFCSPANTEKFIVFLVGFHVMKLTPGNPDWIWSTYYWTRDTNENENGGKKWNAPWNHFHQMTTTAIRENALPPHDICYNPYLEGQQKNGLKANCLSCHSFAAYAPNVDKLSGGGAEDGLTYPYSRAKRILDEQDYFRGAVQTGFVWSISTSQNKPGG